MDCLGKAIRSALSHRDRENAHLDLTIVNKSFEFAVYGMLRNSSNFMTPLHTIIANDFIIFYFPLSLNFLLYQKSVFDIREHVVTYVITSIFLLSLSLKILSKTDDDDWITHYIEWNMDFFENLYSLSLSLSLSLSPRSPNVVVWVWKTSAQYLMSFSYNVCVNDLRMMLIL